MTARSDVPTTKSRRDISNRNTIKFINDYVDDYSSGENDAEENSSDEDEEEAQKAHETAKLLAVSTVGMAKRKTNENIEEETNEDDSDEEQNEPSEEESGEYTNESNSEEAENSKEPTIESEADSEEFVNTRSKVPRPSLVFYNGTNDFEEKSHQTVAKDSLGLTEIGDVAEAHINGPSAYYTMEDQYHPDETGQSRSEIEDPDTSPSTGPTSDTSTTEVNSIWNDAKVAEEKLGNIPYPTDDSRGRLKLFMDEDGVNKGDPGKRKSRVEEVGTEHKKLISDLMQNINGGKTIGEKFASKLVNPQTKLETSSDGIPVIRSMTTRKVSTSVPLNNFPGKKVDEEEGDGGKRKADDKAKGGRKQGHTKQNVHKVKVDKSYSNVNEKSKENQEKETYQKLKLSVEKQKMQPVKNKTWEAEVNTLFPGKANEKLVLPVDDGEASDGLSKRMPVLGKPSKKHNVNKGTESQRSSKISQVNEKRKPTSKETLTDNVQVSTKRQCLGISMTDCIGPDSVTFNVPMNGQGSVGVQVDNMKAPEILYPPGAGYNYQNGFQPPNQFPPDMRQFPAAFPSSANADVQQQYGGLQALNGYDNRPHDYPGGFPDHYPNNLPNIPQSRPIDSKNRPTAPTMKPSENSIYKGGARKKKKKKKQKTTTPKPKKTTTKCPNCDKSKKVKSSGGKKIPFTDKLWKLKKKKTTTTEKPPTKPKTTPINTER